MPDLDLNEELVSTRAYNTPGTPAATSQVGVKVLGVLQASCPPCL